MVGKSENDKLRLVAIKAPASTVAAIEAEQTRLAAEIGAPVTLTTAILSLIARGARARELIDKLR